MNGWLLVVFGVGWAFVVELPLFVLLKFYYWQLERDLLRGHKMDRKVIEYEVTMLHVLILQYVLHKMEVNLNHPGSETSPQAHGYISPNQTCTSQDESLALQNASPIAQRAKIEEKNS